MVRSCSTITRAGSRSRIWSASVGVAGRPGPRYSAAGRPGTAPGTTRRRPRRGRDRRRVRHSKSCACGRASSGCSTRSRGGRGVAAAGRLLTRGMLGPRLRLDAAKKIDSTCDELARALLRCGGSLASTRRITPAAGATAELRRDTWRRSTEPTGSAFSALGCLEVSDTDGSRQTRSLCCPQRDKCSRNPSFLLKNS